MLPQLQRLVEEGVGEAEGGVAFVEVEYDAPGNGEAGMRYMVSELWGVWKRVVLTGM